jgi:hypothetical protein
MPGVTRNTDDVRLLRLCAKEYDVTLRTVSAWRKDDDPRWLDWKKARQGGRPKKEVEPPPPLPEVDDDGLGEGIEAEIFRLMAECKRLAHKAFALEEAGDFESAALVHRILESKRDSLRKLAKDNPDILERAGELLPKAIMFAYVTRVKMMLEALPRRLMAVVPDDMRDTIKPAMDKEVAAICAAAQEIDLNK